MSTTVSPEYVQAFSDKHNLSESDARLFIASIHKRGAQDALCRFPDIPPARVIGMARELDVDDVVVPHDLYGRCFPACGLRWNVAPIDGMDKFSVSIHSRDTTALQIRLSFKMNDVAYGRGRHSKPVSMLLKEARGNPVIRTRIIKAVRPVAVSYLRSAILKSSDVPWSIKRFAPTISRHVLSDSRLLPFMVPTPRAVPHHNGDGHREISIDIGFSMAFELSTPTRDTGAVVPAVEIEDRGVYFKVSAEAKETAIKLRLAAEDQHTRGNIEAAAVLLEKATDIVEALTPLKRKVLKRQLLTKGPMPATRTEVITLQDTMPGDDEERALNEVDPYTVKVTDLAKPEIITLASFSVDRRKADDWWKESKTVLSAGLKQIAQSLTINGVEGGPTKEDIPFLVDASMTKLSTMVSNTGSDVPHDAAVVKLAVLLSALLERTIR